MSSENSAQPRRDAHSAVSFSSMRLVVLLAAVGCARAEVSYPRMVMVTWTTQPRPDGPILMFKDLWTDLTTYRYDGGGLTIAGRRANYAYGEEVRDSITFVPESKSYLPSQLKDLEDCTKDYDGYMKLGKKP